MARDVAERDLDQAGFRISNLGDPKSVKDATRTDNTSMPKPAAGVGAPGTSLLAAAADHVHPAAPGSGSGRDVLVIDDPTLQEVSNESALIWESAVNFAELPGDKAVFTLSAIAFAPKGKGTLELRVGGDPGQTDGTPVLKIECPNPDSEVKVASAEVPKPLNPLSVKLIASATGAADVLRVRGKALTIRGASHGG